MNLPTPKSSGCWALLSPEKPLVLLWPASDGGDTHVLCNTLPSHTPTAVGHLNVFWGRVRDPFLWKVSEMNGFQAGLNSQTTQAAEDSLFETVTRDLKGFLSGELPGETPLSHVGIAVTTPEQALAAARALAGQGAQAGAGAQLQYFLFIPGEFCRQADLLTACRDSKLPLILEKGAFLPPTDMVRAYEKLAGSDVLLLDAGAAFGHGDRVLDVRSLFLLRATGACVGVNLIELGQRPDNEYPYKAQWLQSAQFMAPLFTAAQALGSVCYLIDSVETWKGTKA